VYYYHIVIIILSPIIIVASVRLSQCAQWPSHFFFFLLDGQSVSYVSFPPSLVIVGGLCLGAGRRGKGGVSGEFADCGITAKLHTHTGAGGLEG
jgi:hypothetical protein